MTVRATSGQDVVLAIDVGTSLAKLQCFCTDGRALGPILSARTPVQPDGTADALTFVRVVESLLDRFCADPTQEPRGRTVAVRGCALTCLWHGLAGLDAAGDPCTPVSTWMDSSAGAEAEELRRLVADEAAVHERTGCRLHPSYVPARLLRLRRTEPQAWRRVRSWVSAGELLLGHWCGSVSPASLSMTSASGLFNSRLGCWDDELTRLIGVPDSTLPVVSDDWRRLSPAHARRWPSLAEALWMPALGDGACSVVGSGAAGCATAGGGIFEAVFPEGFTAPGSSAPGVRVAVSLGTSASARLVTEWDRRFDRPLSPALFAYALDARRAVVGVARSNAMNLMQWAERVLNFSSVGEAKDVVEQIVRERLPGSSGLMVSSALAGERSPDWPVAGRGLLGGLSLGTSSMDILQGLVESAVVGLVRSVRELEAWSGPVDLILSGGGARSPGWQHMIADGFGRPVLLSDVADTSLRGAALLCLERLGSLILPDECGPALATIEPDPLRSEAFAELAEAWGSQTRCTIQVEASAAGVLRPPANSGGQDACS